VFTRTGDSVPWGLGSGRDLRPNPRARAGPMVRSSTSAWSQRRKEGPRCLRCGLARHPGARVPRWRRNEHVHHRAGRDRDCGGDGRSGRCPADRRAHDRSGRPRAPAGPTLGQKMDSTRGWIPGVAAMMVNIPTYGGLSSTDNVTGTRVMRRAPRPSPAPPAAGAVPGRARTCLTSGRSTNARGAA
jgi:hypothetical protein